MSLVDSVFGSIPTPLIAQWGISGFYYKYTEDQIYDPDLGTFANSIDPETGNPSVLSQKVSIKLLPTQLSAEEVNGEVQLTDIKLLVPASYLGNYYPKVSDWVEYSQAGQTRIAKIILPSSYRGDNPVLHSLIARLG